jgi:hypothetical protein
VAKGKRNVPASIDVPPCKREHGGPCPKDGRKDHSCALPTGHQKLGMGGEHRGCTRRDCGFRDKSTACAKAYEGKQACNGSGGAADGYHLCSSAAHNGKHFGCLRPGCKTWKADSK